MEIAASGRCLLVDPYLYPHSGRAHYVCLTREDHDHCHEPTLQRLVRGPAFERLLAPRSCTMASRLDSPVTGRPTDLAFVDPDRLTVVYPKHTRKPGRRCPEPTALTLDGFHIEVTESSEHEPVTVAGSEGWGKRYRPDDGQQWPSGTGRYVGGGEVPNLGYVIRALASGLTFFHPGDLQEAFDSQRELRGRIDYLFLPLASLEGVELSLIDNVRPRWVIPIHYRVPGPRFPIPLDIAEETLTTTDLGRGRPRSGADPGAYRREIHAMMEAHWYPTPREPLERIREITPEVNALGAEIIVLEGGQPYELPGCT